MSTRVIVLLILRFILSSRIFIICIILTIISVLLALTLVPNLMNTTRSFYNYNDTTYQPKDIERWMYNLKKDIGTIEKEHPKTEIYDYASEEAYKRAYRLRQKLKEMEMTEEIRRSQERLKEIDK